jgi:hypothetical protein
MKISFVGVCTLGVLGLVGCRGVDEAGQSGSDVNFSGDQSAKAWKKCTLWPFQPVFSSKQKLDGYMIQNGIQNSDGAIDTSAGGEVVEFQNGESNTMQIKYKQKDGKMLVGWMESKACDYYSVRD